MWRPESVGRQIQEILSELVHKRLKDPRLGFVTVTDVRTSPDLRRATVYYSVLDATDQEGTAAALASSHHRIQRAIAQQAHLKYTPVLEFSLDDALERGLRINKLLHDLEEDND